MPSTCICTRYGAAAVASGAEDGSVKVWNFSSGALLSTLATPDYSHEWGSRSGAEVTGLAVSGSNNARNFVVAGWDRKVGSMNQADKWKAF
jgi:WD40 repeat protein